MKLYKWAIVEMAERLKESRAILDLTHQRVSRSLESLKNFDETAKKATDILGHAARK